MSEARPTALLVEDEPQIRRFVRAALEQEGWQVHEAGSLREGTAAVGTRSPDLVVLDLGLPDGDGIDLIRDVRGWSAVPRPRPRTESSARGRWIVPCTASVRSAVP